MTNEMVMLECLKLAVTLSSPSASDRVAEVERISGVLYKLVFPVKLPDKGTDTLKSGRPRKPRTVTADL